MVGLLLPLRDENPTSSPPHITRLLIIVNVIVFIFMWLPSYLPIDFPSFWASISPEEVVWKYGMIPENIMNGERLYTIFTSMFLHGGIIHLAGNMLFLSIFGDNIEDTFGRARYVLFYFLCGTAASLTHTLITVDLSIPTIGASGAISGILGAYLILYPRARVLTIVFYGWISFVRIPAIFFLGFWFILQWLYILLEAGGGVAYWAHIGGFVAGMALAPLLKRRKH